MTMFQEPRRRNEGTNLREPRESHSQEILTPSPVPCPLPAGLHEHVQRPKDASGGCFLGVGQHSPLVEGGRPFLDHHGEHAVQGVLVLPAGRVHVPRLHHVHRRSHHRGTESSAEGSHKVAREIVCGHRGRRVKPQDLGQWVAALETCLYGHEEVLAISYESCARHCPSKVETN